MTTNDTEMKWAAIREDEKTIIAGFRYCENDENKRPSGQVIITIDHANALITTGQISFIEAPDRATYFYRGTPSEMLAAFKAAADWQEVLNLEKLETVFEDQDEDQDDE